MGEGVEFIELGFIFGRYLRWWDGDVVEEGKGYKDEGVELGGDE